MAFSVRTAASYDARFELALKYRLEFAGRTSARRLLAAQEKAERMLESFPYLGSPVQRDLEDAAGDVPRWVKVDSYIAVYETFPAEEVLVFEDLFYPGEDWRPQEGLS